MGAKRPFISLPAAVVFLITMFTGDLLSQDQTERIEHKKGSFFFYWGYNRSYFSKTNLHFNGPDYDFTLYDLEATDRPSPFGTVYFNPNTISVPQYNYRLGYHITDRLVVSGGMDHMKYVVTKNQWTTISGVITGEASPEYAGYYLNEPIQLKPDLLQFEHTNGFNLLTLDFEYLLPIVDFRKPKLKLYWNTGFGGVWVVTKTDVRVLGEGLDNDFHIAGYALAGKAGPRLDFRNRFFLLAELKGFYSNLPSVLIKNDAPELGDHNILGVEYYVVFGVNFGGKNRAANSQDPDSFESK